MSFCDRSEHEATETSQGFWGRMAPVAALLALAPFIVDVEFGVIRATNAIGFLPALAAWGCGSLLIREFVRRRGGGWTSILVLGMALAVAEECIFLQTSLYPLIGVDPDHAYGRCLGVNWPYLIWSLGYESVWAVVIPIWLVEWMFPQRRLAPWIGNRGLAILVFIFVAAGVLRWYAWTQVFIPQFFPAYARGPSPVHLGVSLIVISLLVSGAMSLSDFRRPDGTAPAHEPTIWMPCLVSFACGIAWFALLLLAYGAVPSLPLWIPLSAGVALGAAVFFGVDRWSTRRDWKDAHSLSLATGAILACSLAGFLILKGSNAPTFDYVGKIILNVLSIFALLWLAARRRKSTADTTRSTPANPDFGTIEHNQEPLNTTS